MGGSAFSKALIKMEVASATGGDALEDFGKVAGMTGQQFKALWDSDPAAAFQSFIVGLSKLDDEDGLTIGKAGNPLTFRVVNDRLAFYMNDTEVAYLSDNKLYVTQAEILARLQIGKFAYEPQSNGNLSVIYTG